MGKIFFSCANIYIQAKYINKISGKKAILKILTPVYASI